MKALKILVAASAVLALATAHAASGDVTVSSGSVAAGSVSVGTGASVGTSATLNVEGYPSIVSATPTSVTLQWNQVAAAVSYVVKYSTGSVADSVDPNAVYDHETAPVTATGTMVDKLVTGTPYYFAVVALDADGNESDSLSEELRFVPGSAIAASGSVASGTLAAFAIDTVTAKDARTLTLTFSAPLGADKVTIRIQKTANSASIPVTDVVADIANPNAAVATLGADLEGDSTYSLTVVSAKDNQGNNIAEGVNAIKEFTTVASLAPAAEAPLNSAATESGSTESGSVAVAAPTALPATGTKENLLLIFALLSGLGIVFAFRKKVA